MLFVKSGGGSRLSQKHISHSFRNTETVPIVVYADFECYLQKVAGIAAFVKNTSLIVLEIQRESSHCSLRRFRMLFAKSGGGSRVFQKHIFQSVGIFIHYSFENAKSEFFVEEEQHGITEVCATVRSLKLRETERERAS